MTNKLPEIGAKYRLTTPCEKSEQNYRIEVVYISGDVIHYRLPSSDFLDYIHLEHFWEDYEPLPREQEEVAISKKETTSAEDVSWTWTPQFDVAEMQVAKEELKNKLEYIKDNITGDFVPLEAIDFNAHGDDVAELFNFSLHLVEALEDMGKKDDNLPMKEESLPKSIWKDEVVPTSEYIESVHNQSFSPELINYLLLVLNQQEQNTKDIAELKQLIKGE